ncbi:outer membrane protein assembly factor BamB family protein [Occultella glacieicola]|nr:PQQ-binding-like beta-propeller repeat protein [Occultella glacieicola]
MRRRGIVIALSAALLAGIGVVGYTTVLPAWQCRRGSELVEADRLGLDLRQSQGLNTTGAVTDVVAALEDNGPFGGLSSGTVVAPWNAASVIAVDDGVLLASGSGSTGNSFAGAVLSLDPASGSVRWARGYDGYAPGGGQVGEDIVTLVLPEDRTAAVSALDARTGRWSACTWVGTNTEHGFAPTLATARIPETSEILLAQDVDDDPDLSLTRMTPGTGDVAWTVPMTGLPSADDLTVLGGAAVLSRFNERDIDYTVGLNLANQGTDTRTVAAFSTADGSPLWRYPAEEDPSSPVISTVLGASDTGRGTLVLTTMTTPDLDSVTADTVRWDLVGVDPRTGEPRWTIEIPYGARASLTGDTLLYSSGPGDLHGLDVTTGAELWTLAHEADEWFQTNRAVTLGTQILVPTNAEDLWLVDAATGTGTRTEMPDGVYSFTITDTSIVVGVETYTDGDALLLFDRADPVA